MDEPYDFTRQAGHLMRKAYQKHLAIFQENAGDPNLTAVQFVTLCALAEHGAGSQADLVKWTAVDQATIRGIIERLKARGLVTIGRDAGDARKLALSLTSEGRRVQADMVPRARLITERTLEALNPAERIALIYLLQKLSDTPEVEGKNY